MKHSIKDSLSSKLENYAPTYNLPDLQFSSFQMEMGYKRAFSASDAVYGVTALLEAHALEEVRPPLLPPTADWLRGCVVRKRR